MLTLPPNFATLLSEAQAWCSRPEVHAQNYRSAEILPDTPTDFWGHFGKDHAGCQAMVADYFRRRGEALARLAGQGSADAANGRLLLFNSDNTLDDGLAEDCSRGLFDAHNTPGWDTWIRLCLKTAFEGTFGSWPVVAYHGN
jgi:hypothetical protein